MAYTYRNAVQRALTYAELDENFQTVDDQYTEALQAQDAATLNAGIYATTTAGLAATTNGEYFSVPSAESEGYLDLYKNNAGSAVLTKTYYSRPQGAMEEIGSYSALDAYSGSASVFYVRGGTALFDGAHGVFRRDDTDTTTAASGICRVDAVGRRWKREYSGHVDVRWFGARGNLSANDLNSLNSAYSALLASGGGDLIVPRGYYRVTGPWNIGAVPFTNFEFLVNRIAEIDDTTFAANAAPGADEINNSNRGRGITIIFEEGAYLVADFAPTTLTPVLGYYLTGAYRKSGGLINPAVISMAMISSGEYDFDAVSSKQVNNLIGIFYGNGAKVVKKPFVSGCHHGIVSGNAFWTRCEDAYVAWAGGDALNVAQGNAQSVVNVSAWNSKRGLVIDGDSSDVTGLNFQGVEDELTVFRCDGIEIGPGYFEDVETSSGTGMYSVRLGTAENVAKVLNLKLHGLRTTSQRPGKAALRIWGATGLTVENFRAYGRAVTVDSSSFGQIFGGDISATTRTGKFMRSGDGVNFSRSQAPGSTYSVYGPWIFAINGVSTGSIASGASALYDYVLPDSLNDMNSGVAAVTYTSGGNDALVMTTRLLFTTPKKLRIKWTNNTASAIDPGSTNLAAVVHAGL